MWGRVAAVAGDGGEGPVAGEVAAMAAASRARTLIVVRAVLGTPRVAGSTDTDPAGAIGDRIETALRGLDPVTDHEDGAPGALAQDRDRTVDPARAIWARRWRR